MEKMTLVSKSLVKDTRGSDLVEKLIGVALVALACIAAFSYLGDKIGKKAEELGDRVTDEVN